MVFIWYLYGIYIGWKAEEERCQDRFSTRGKTWRIKRKNYFWRKYLEKSDILFIFAIETIIIRYGKERHKNKPTAIDHK